MKKIMGIWICFCCLGILSCAPPEPMEPVISQVPVPTGFNLTTQKKMQSVHHWKVLAKEVADKIDKRLENKVTMNKKPIYVASSGTTAFEKAFKKLLVSQLVNRGVYVSNQQGNNMILSFEVEIIEHNKRLQRTRQGVYETLVPGIVIKKSNFSRNSKNINFDPRQNIEAGMYTKKLPKREVLISSSLMYKGEYIAKDNSIFYINDKEWWHYQKKKQKNWHQVKNYQIVND